jgi:hypothetical protein
MAGKEIKIEVVEHMTIIAKQLETFTCQRGENQLFLAGLVQCLTVLEQWLLALPPPPDFADEADAHDATSTSLANSTSSAP